MSQPGSARDGLAVDRLEVNGGGPGVLFLHASGFCSGTWDPVIEDMETAGSDFDGILLDKRGHGRSAPLVHPLDWWQLGRDVLTVLTGRGGVIGVGHSAGGTALVMAELLSPGAFARLVLIEPILPEPPYEREEDHPLALGALRRRRSFADHEEAVAGYRGRGPFVGWDERALHGYVAGALEPEPGGGFRLACDPEDEAEFYRSGAVHGAWDRLEELDVPIDLVVGEHSDTHPADYVARMAARLARVNVIWIPDANHFVPMQQPGEVARLVAAAVEEGKRSERL